MAHLGRVVNKDGKFIAKIYTRESDTRFAMEGPRRGDEQQASQDLSSIRAAADGEATRTGGLKAMQLAAKRLRDAAKAIPSGSIEEVDGHFIAKIDSNESGTRFWIEGPLRDDKQQADQDLKYIRAAADGEAKRLAALQAMKSAAKLLRDAAKAAHCGGIEEVGAQTYHARMEYLDKSVKHKILGPRRATERRAQADLAMLREAALGRNESKNLGADALQAPSRWGEPRTYRLL